VSAAPAVPALQASATHAPPMMRFMQPPFY
jgi:hypothetical protein